MKRLFIILASALVMTSVFTSCEQKAVVEESPIKGVWESEMPNLWMALTFDDKKVEYTQVLKSYDAQATYFGTYTISDKAITLNFDSIKTNNVKHPKVEYVEPEDMPKEAILYGDSAIKYLDYTFKRVYVHLD